MLIIDSLIISGVRFVLDKVAAAVETEMNDDSTLRQHLLEAQMRLELGEMTQQEFDDFEADIVARVREIKARQRGGESAAISPKDMKVTGVEASFGGDEHRVRGVYEFLELLHNHPVCAVGEDRQVSQAKGEPTLHGERLGLG